MSSHSSRIEGAAKWAAVAALGLTGIVGVARSFVVERVHDPAVSTQQSSVLVERKDLLVEAKSTATSQQTPTVVSATAVGDPSRTATDPSAVDAISTLINVNQASAAELDLLPGIGPVYAERIIAERELNGRFSSLEDLQRVRGIGPKTASKLSSLVHFGEP